MSVDVSGRVGMTVEGELICPGAAERAGKTPMSAWLGLLAVVLGYGGVQGTRAPEHSRTVL